MYSNIILEEEEIQVEYIQQIKNVLDIYISFICELFSKIQFNINFHESM